MRFSFGWNIVTVGVLEKCSSSSLELNLFEVELAICWAELTFYTPVPIPNPIQRVCKRLVKITSEEVTLRDLRWVDAKLTLPLAHSLLFPSVLLFRKKVLERHRHVEWQHSWFESFKDNNLVYAITSWPRIQHGVDSTCQPLGMMLSAGLQFTTCKDRSIIIYGTTTMRNNISRCQFSPWCYLRAMAGETMRHSIGKFPNQGLLRVRMTTCSAAQNLQVPEMRMSVL